jgi:hypothetical protein
MGSIKRWRLHHETHSTAGNSAASCVFHCLRRPMISGLYSPLTAAARGLLSLSPVLPTEGSMPGSARCWR